MTDDEAAYVVNLEQQVVGLQEYVMALMAIAINATKKNRETLEHEAMEIIKWVRANPDGAETSDV